MMLLLIDYQLEFINLSASKFDTMLANTLWEIEQAKQQGQTILSLLYTNYGPTIPELSEVLDDYRNHFERWKNFDCGQPQVIDFLEDCWQASDALRTGDDNIRAMGGNLSACVRKTILPLADWLKDHRYRCQMHLNISASYGMEWWLKCRENADNLWRDFRQAGIHLHDPDMLWSHNKKRLSRAA